MFTTNRLSWKHLPDDCGDGEGYDDREDRHQHRDRHAEERPDDQQQHDQCCRQSELQLALVLGRSRRAL